MKLNYSLAQETHDTVSEVHRKTETDFNRGRSVHRNLVFLTIGWLSGIAQANPDKPEIAAEANVLLKKIQEWAKEYETESLATHRD